MTTTPRHHLPIGEPKWFNSSIIVAVFGTLCVTSHYHAVTRDVTRAHQQPVIIRVIDTQLQPQPSVESAPPENQLFVDAAVDWASAYNKGVDQKLIKQYVTVALAESSTQRVDPLLTIAVMAVESRFDSMATSSAGAKGLMQIIPRYHKDKIAHAQIYDPVANIKAGTKIIREYLTLHKEDVDRALLNYNGALGIRGATYHSKVLRTRTTLNNFINGKLTANAKLQLNVVPKYNQLPTNTIRKLEI